jgi:hypothetical protein
VQVRGSQLILRERAPWWSFMAPSLEHVSEHDALQGSIKVYAILFVKEIYPVTYYAFWLLALCVCVVLGVVLLIVGFVLLGPVLWAFEKMLGGDIQVL